MSLHAELQRIADAAPVADVPRDTWARGRRARLRARAATLAAGVALVAIVAGLVTWLPRHAEAPVATGDPAGPDAAVPSHVWAVPERMAGQRNDGSWSRSEVTRDLAVGRAAAAFQDWGLPVVIGARDGAYHLLDLPGWTGSQLLLRGEPGGLAISPDGRWLAYSWAGRATATAPVPSGVRVVDLESGAVRTVAVPGGEGVVVSTLVWSPDGTWIVWSGDQKGSWTAGSMGGSTLVAGRIAPGSTSSEPIPSFGQDDSTAWAITDAGAVTAVTGARMLHWDGDLVVRQPVRLPQVHDRSAAISPDGTAVAFGSWRTDAATSVDTATGRLVRHRLPGGVYTDGARARPLGWIDDRLVVSEVQPVTAADQPAGEAQVVVATREVSGPSTYRIVGHLDVGVEDTLSVAVDLMTLDRPTVDRPEPDWPWSDERRAAVGVVAALLLVGAGLGTLRWRRRRPR